MEWGGGCSRPSEQFTEQRVISCSVLTTSSKFIWHTCFVRFVGIGSVNQAPKRKSIEPHTYIYTNMYVNTQHIFLCTYQCIFCICILIYIFGEKQTRGLAIDSSFMLTRHFSLRNLSYINHLPLSCRYQKYFFYYIEDRHHHLNPVISPKNEGGKIYLSCLTALS